MPDDDLSSSLSSIFVERATLMNVALKMLGSTRDAEDVVQEAYARWHAMSREAQRAFVQAAEVICLDRLPSARAPQEHDTGERLPDDTWGTGTVRPDQAQDPADHVTLDNHISMSMLMCLDSITPGERVAFILHYIFRMPLAEVADIVGRTPEDCQRLAASARRSIQSNPHQAIAPDQPRGIVTAFKSACETGDLDALIRLLDPQISVLTDGTGKVRTTQPPILGPEKTAQFFLGLLRKGPGLEITVENVSGLPGLVARLHGEIMAVISSEIHAGRITQIRIMLNPYQLRDWKPSESARSVRTWG